MNEETDNRYHFVMSGTSVICEIPGFNARMDGVEKRLGRIEDALAFLAFTISNIGAAAGARGNPVELRLMVQHYNENMRKFDLEWLQDKIGAAVNSPPPTNTDPKPVNGKESP